MKLTRSLLLACLLAAPASAGVIVHPSKSDPPPPAPASQPEEASWLSGLLALLGLG